MKADIQAGIKPVSSLAVANRTASANGAAVDAVGYMGAMALLIVAAFTSGSGTLKLQHAPDNGSGAAGAWVDVPVAQLQFDADQFNASGALVVDGAPDVGIYTIGYFGTNRHLRVVETITTGDFDAGAVILLGAPRFQGVSQLAT